MRNRNPAFEAGVIEQAKRHVGYRSQPERRSAMQLKPYLGKPWNGTFVDRVLHDAFGDFAEVRFVSTVAALGYYVARNRVYRKPQPGDIVFFNFASNPQEAFEQPHVGVVTEVNRAERSFRTVEGETSPGNPQGSQLADGVFERVRYMTDVVGFVRPKARVRHETVDATVKMSYFESNGKTVARAIEAVQSALAAVRPGWMPNRKTGIFNRGKRDGVFKSALGTYARETGTVENRGEITMPVLQTLGDETGLEVKP